MEHLRDYVLASALGHADIVALLLARGARADRPHVAVEQRLVFHPTSRFTSRYSSSSSLLAAFFGRPVFAAMKGWSSLMRKGTREGHLAL